MGLGRIVGKSVLAIGLLGVAAFSFSVGEQRQAVVENREAAASIFQPLVVHKLRSSLVSEIQRDATSRNIQLEQHLARRAPLDALVFETALARSISNGQTAMAKRLANDVMVRQPRSLAARLFLLSSAAQAHDTRSLLTQYERLVALRSIDQAALSDALIGVFRESQDWSKLLDYLKTDRAAREGLVQRLINERIPAGDLQSLVALYPKLQKIYLSRVLREEGYRATYDAWREFGGLQDNVGVSVPFNGEFSTSTAPAPFNWQINGDHAEVQSAGGLYVTYFGTGRPYMARQITASETGRYVLRTEVRGRMPENGGSLEWLLTCAENNRKLMTSEIKLTRRGEPEVFEAEFSIPAEDCAFQKLELWGRAGAFPRTSRLEILSVHAEPRTD